ncbi:hypothetical protein ACQY0O_008182 [Thecaphora frezii]
MLCWDLVTSILFDLSLFISTFRGPYWYEPIRLLTRFAYFSARRYGLFFGTFWLGNTFLGVYVYENFGGPMRVPGSQFCVWLPPTRDSRVVNLDHVYIILTLVFDLLVLLATLHGLVEGGLVELAVNAGVCVRHAFGRYRDDDPVLGWGSLSLKLVEQGVALYGLAELFRVSFVVAILLAPSHAMPIFLRANMQNSLNPVVLRMLLQGQARYLSEASRFEAYALDDSERLEVSQSRAGGRPSMVAVEPCAQNRPRFSDVDAFPQQLHGSSMAASAQTAREEVSDKDVAAKRRHSGRASRELEGEKPLPVDGGEGEKRG